MTGQPFYVGESVIAVDALKGSEIKNGLIYQVYSCEYKHCNGSMFWYVGVERENYTSHNRIRPSIFAPISKAKLMVFTEISKEVPIHAN